MAQPVPPAPPVATNDNDNRAAIIAVSLLGLAVFGAMGAAFAVRRRRNPELKEEREATTYERENLATKTVSPAPVAPASQPALTTPAPAFSAGTAMPADPVPRGKDREALIAQIVAAAPDAENPYTSVSKRRRKARMILAAREGEEASTAREFDFRNYRPSTTTRALSDGDSIDA